MVELLIVSLTGLCVTQSRMRQSSPERQLLFCRVADSHDRGTMDQRSRRIPVSRFRPGKLKIQTARQLWKQILALISTTKEQIMSFKTLVLPCIRILQLNIEGISTAKYEILSTICSKHQIDIICLQEVHAKADISRSRLVIDNYDLAAFAGHQQCTA